jgi:UDP-2,3-diacylglucosamine hydrolase
MADSTQNPKNQTQTQSVYFISDAHLTFDTSTKEKVLADFLFSLQNKASHLYIIGDLFDFWFEYKHAVPAAYLRTLATLRALVDSGMQITYLPGNHDFWMGDYLAKQAGVRLAGDSVDIEHQGKKIHLYHGDGLAYGDKAYRIMKKLFRFKPNIWLYRQLPVDLAYRLAHKTSANSRERNHSKDKDLQGYYDYAKAKINSGFDAVIMGHTHFPEIKQLGKGQYINTGDWIDHFSYVVLESGEFTLRYKNGK